jgi:hypothetical protein
VKKYGYLLTALSFFLLVILNCRFAYAISEYGLRCIDNPECVKCSNTLKCVKCMHRCWNYYGYADTDLKRSSKRTPEENCQLKLAKWCNAQCWNPDDQTIPNYVSTKPDCSDGEFSFPEGHITFPQNRPDF